MCEVKYGRSLDDYYLSIEQYDKNSTGEDIVDKISKILLKVDTNINSVYFLFNEKYGCTSFTFPNGCMSSNIIDLLKKYNILQLTICESNLSELPHNLGDLNNLYILDVPYASELKSLPNSFGNLSELTYIDFRNNEVNGMPIPLNIRTSQKGDNGLKETYKNGQRFIKWFNDNCLTGRLTKSANKS